MPSADDPKNQLVEVSKARLPPHSPYPAGLRLRSVASQSADPPALYPPLPPTPVSPRDIARPPTYTTMAFAGTLRFATCACWPFAGLKKLAVNELPPPGVMAVSEALRWLPTSFTACCR